MRVGRIVGGRAFPEARKPAYRLTHRLRAGRRAALVGAAARHLPRSRGAGGPAGDRRGQLRAAPHRGFESEVLVLGALPADGRIPLLGVDAAPHRAIRSAERPTSPRSLSIGLERGRARYSLGYAGWRAGGPRGALTYAPGPARPRERLPEPTAGRDGVLGLTGSQAYAL